MEKLLHNSALLEALADDIEDNESQNDTGETTIDDMAAAVLVDDLHRAMGVFVCSPQNIEDGNVCGALDDTPECVSEGQCFHSQRTPKWKENGLRAEQSKVEVLYDGDYNTIVTSTTMQSTVTNDDTYQSFDEISTTQRTKGFFRKLFRNIR